MSAEPAAAEIFSRAKNSLISAGNTLPFKVRVAEGFSNPFMMIEPEYSEDPRLAFMLLIKRLLVFGVFAAPLEKDPENERSFTARLDFP